MWVVDYGVHAILNKKHVLTGACIFISEIFTKKFPKVFEPLKRVTQMVHQVEWWPPIRYDDYILFPGSTKATIFGGRDFVDANKDLKVRSFWLNRLSPKPNSKYPS